MTLPRVEASERARTGGPLNWRRLAFALGPGVVVMLADTDAGSVFTAAQSGADLGYKLLLPQFLIIPVLFAMQELAIRLGVGSGLGLSELIRRRLGKGWMTLAVAVLALSCFGALVTQLSALAGVGRLFGLPIPLTVAATVAFFVAIAATGTYASVERVAIAIGLFELAFLFVAWRSKPDLATIASDMGRANLSDSGYLYLLAANLGTSFMPWAAFYQQSATVDKGLTRGHYQAARLETLGGAILCQIITAAVLIAGTATRARSPASRGLASIADLVATFSATLGPDVGRIIFALGLTGAALVAAIVVTLTIAWSVGEFAGLGRSLDHRLREAPAFYAAFIAFLVAGGLFVATGVDPTRLSLAVGVLNAVLIPIVLALLFRLARTELPEDLRLSGPYAVVLALVFIATSALSLYAGLAGAFS